MIVNLSYTAIMLKVKIEENSRKPEKYYVYAHLPGVNCHILPVKFKAAGQASPQVLNSSTL